MSIQIQYLDIQKLNQLDWAPLVLPFRPPPATAVYIIFARTVTVDKLCIVSQLLNS